MEQQPPQPQMGTYLAGNPAPTQDEKTWGMLAHLSGLIASLVGLPFLGPLVVMLTKGKESAWVLANAKEALNFQITVTIALAVCAVLTLACIGAFLLPIVGVAALVFTIIAALKANNGEMYRYPATLRLVK